MNINFTSGYFWFFQIIGWLIYGSLDIYMKQNACSLDTKLVVGNLITYGTGIVSTLLLRFLYKNITKRTLSNSILFVSIVLLSTVTGAFWYLLDLLASIPLHSSELFLRALSSLSVLEYTSYNMLVIVAWSGLYFGIKFSMELRSERIVTENLQLQMLRYQLNPHFLFNSLCGLRVLIKNEPERAIELLNRLSEFYYYSLKNQDNLNSTLQEELDLVKNYLIIQKFRYGNKLNYQIDVPDSLGYIDIPSFLLYPIVENSIKYGIETCTLPLNVLIKVIESDIGIYISIKNNGRWVSNSEDGAGTGLKNINTRLQKMYKEKFDFNIVESEGEVEATIKLEL